MTKVPLYIPEPLEGAPLARWFTPLHADALYTKDLPSNFFEQDVERVSIEGAVAVVLPNNFHRLDARGEAYIKKHADAAAAHTIPIFCFSLGDLTDTIHFDPRVQVFRLSVYGSTMDANDIVMPTATEDHGRESVVMRHKTPLPVVSFCGLTSGRPNISALEA